MIIDAHSHLGRYQQVWSERMANALLQQFGKFPRWWDRSAPWSLSDFHADEPEAGIDAYVRRLSDLGIDKAVVMGIACAPFAAHTPVEFIAAAVARYPDRLIGLHAMDPAGYPGHGPGELERAVRDFGMRGCKIYCGYNNAAPDDRRLFPLYDTASSLGAVVAIHTGYTCTHAGPSAYAPLSLQHPLRVEDVAANFPNLKIVMTHFANPWNREAIQVMRKYDNIYADTAYGAFPASWKAETLMWAKNFGLLNKVIFGSDDPLHSPEESLRFHRSLPRFMRDKGYEPAVTEEDMAGVLGQNAIDLYGLG